MEGWFELLEQSGGAQEEEEEEEKWAKEMLVLVTAFAALASGGLLSTRHSPQVGGLLALDTRQPSPSGHDPHDLQPR